MNVAKCSLLLVGTNVTTINYYIIYYILYITNMNVSKIFIISNHKKKI